MSFGSSSQIVLPAQLPLVNLDSVYDEDDVIKMTLPLFSRMVKALTTVAAFLAFTLFAHAQHVADPRASLIDVPARQSLLKSTKEPLLRDAIRSLSYCTRLPPVPAPKGRMIIPNGYLSGSSGPHNPAAAVAAKIYDDLGKRVAAGMNQYLATGSHAESACALDQLDAWAKAGALLDYDRKESQQAWFQVEWTLSAIAVSESVLAEDDTLDPAEQKRVIAWMDEVSNKNISFERPATDTGNNHHAWRALAATAVGILASDDKLFQFGIATYKEEIGTIDQNGALPREMVRHENSVHYQGFALQPLLLIAQFDSRQGIDLWSYTANGHTIRDAIVFFGRSASDFSLIKPYTNDEQRPGFPDHDFAVYNFYVAKFGADGLPPIIVKALRNSVSDDRLGGNTTLLVAK